MKIQFFRPAPRFCYVFWIYVLRIEYYISIQLAYLCVRRGRYLEKWPRAARWVNFWRDATHCAPVFSVSSRRHVPIIHLSHTLFFSFTVNSFPTAPSSLCWRWLELELWCSVRGVARKALIFAEWGALNDGAGKSPIVHMLWDCFSGES